MAGLLKMQRPCGRYHPPIATLEQGVAQPGFKRPDLRADCCRCYVQFFGGKVERTKPHGGLERAEAGERRETLKHSVKINLSIQKI